MTKRIMAVAIALVTISLFGVRIASADTINLLRLVPANDFVLDASWAGSNKKLSRSWWYGCLARANASPCERSAMMKRTGETPVPPEVGF